MQVPEAGTVVTVRSLRVEKGPEQKAQRKERAAAIDVDSVNGDMLTKLVVRKFFI
jgi:hypothetical protein